MSTTALLLSSSSSSSLSQTVCARPGTPFHPSTTFIFSTSSFTIPPKHNHPINKNELRHRTKRRLPSSTNLFSPDNVPHRIIMPRPAVITDLPLGFRSFKDLAKDILNVIVACGALSAGTIYIVWPILTHRHGFYRSLDDDDDNVDANEKSSVVDDCYYC